MSNTCLNYCSDPLGSHTQNDECTSVAGQASDIVLFDCGAGITDAFDPVEVNAAIAAGTAVLISDVLIGIPEASPIEVDSRKACNNIPTVVNYDRTFTLIDTHVNANNINTLYAGILNGRKLEGALIRTCGSSFSIWIDDTIRIVGSHIIPDTEDIQTVSATGKWRSLDAPTIGTTPAGVF